MGNFSSASPEVKRDISKEELRAEFLARLENVPTEELQSVVGSEIRSLAGNPKGEIVKQDLVDWYWEEVRRRKDRESRESERIESERREAEKIRRAALREALAPAERAKTLAEEIFESRGAKPPFAKGEPLPITVTANRIKPFGLAFGSQLWPDGIPGQEYWKLPSDYGISKLSIHPVYGGVFYLRDGGEFVKGSNYVMAWIYRFYGDGAFYYTSENVLRVRETRILKNATRDCAIWAKRMEAGYKPPRSLTLEARYEEITRALAILAPADRPVKGSRIKVRKALLSRALKSLPEREVRLRLPELYEPTRFRRFLEYLLEYGSPSLAATGKTYNHTFLVSIVATTRTTGKI
jgi:hypothetical protein